MAAITSLLSPGDIFHSSVVLLNLPGRVCVCVRGGGWNTAKVDTIITMLSSLSVFILFAAKKKTKKHCLWTGNGETDILHWIRVWQPKTRNSSNTKTHSRLYTYMLKRPSYFFGAQFHCFSCTFTWQINHSWTYSDKSTFFNPIPGSLVLFCCCCSHSQCATSLFQTVIMGK